MKQNPDYVLDVLAEGARRSREIAAETMRQVRERMGLRADAGPGASGSK
jgi:tryptophanyl-tRNA synthetase